MALDGRCVLLPAALPVPPLLGLLAALWMWPIGHGPPCCPSTAHTLLCVYCLWPCPTCRSSTRRAQVSRCPGLAVCLSATCSLPGGRGMRCCSAGSMALAAWAQCLAGNAAPGPHQCWPAPRRHLPPSLLPRVARCGVPPHPGWCRQGAAGGPDIDSHHLINYANLSTTTP